MFLISDTNASIKFAAFGKLLFTDDSIIGELGSCADKGRKELKQLSRQNLPKEMKNCVDCALENIGFFDFCEFCKFEFWDYETSYYKDAEQSVLEKYELGGACENDKYFLHLAVTYGNTLVTNDLPLYYLGKEVIELDDCPIVEGFDVKTVEDLIIQAYDAGYLTKPQIKDVIKTWNKTKRSVLKIKRDLFIKRKLV